MHIYILTSLYMSANAFRWLSTIAEYVGILSVVTAIRSLKYTKSSVRRHKKKYTIQEAQKFTKYIFADSRKLDKIAHESKTINRYEKDALRKLKKHVPFKPYNQMPISIKKMILKTMNICIYSNLLLKLNNWCRCFRTGYVDRRLMAQQIGKDYVQIMDNHKNIFKYLNYNHNFDMCYNVYVEMRTYINNK